MYYLRFPLHSDGTYEAHDDYGNCANNSDVIDATIDNLKTIRAQKIIQRVAEADGVHRCCNSVGECENNADGSAKFWAQ